MDVIILCHVLGKYNMYTLWINNHKVFSCKEIKKIHDYFKLHQLILENPDKLNEHQLAYCDFKYRGNDIRFHCDVYITHYSVQHVDRYDAPMYNWLRCDACKGTGLIMGFSCMRCHCVGEIMMEISK